MAETQRAGIGYDVHRLVAGRRLVLGGVEIASDRGLEGHSDADVVAHAIADAILGAMSLGDLGQHFPPGDPKFKDIASISILKHVAVMVGARGGRIVHLDASVIAETPRLAPYIEAMRRELSKALGISMSAVSIKATTHEGLGALGRGEGIAALAIATLAVAD